MHTIRLRGPWQADDGKRVKLPESWSAALGDRTQTTLSRKFHWVRDLADVKAVTLRVRSPQEIARIHLNGADLQPGADVRGHLAASNELSIRIVCQAPTADVAEVSLEVVGN